VLIRLELKLRVDKYPHTIKEVTKEWLSVHLEGAVTHFDVEPLVLGAFSEAFRLHNLGYDNPGDQLPSSVVLKLPHSDRAQREVALASGVYLKEVRFYADLAADAPVSCPKIFAVQEDGIDRVESFAILMEDLGQHSAVFDQLDDLPDEAYTRRIASEAAALHARYWDSDILAEPWLTSPEGKYTFPLDAAARNCAQNFALYSDVWNRIYGTSFWHGDDTGEFEKLTRIATGPLCGTVVDRITDILDSRPKTLIHGDLRPDNIFRTVGSTPNEAQITFIDWQLVCASPPGPELGWAWFSLPTDLRRRDLKMLQSYHETLTGLAPTAAGYTLDHLIEDYRLSLVLWHMALITIGAAMLSHAETTADQRTIDLWRQGVPRFRTSLTDHGCLDMVQQLLI